jgi:hypothetical protein
MDIISRNRNRPASDIADAVIRRAERIIAEDQTDPLLRSEYGAPAGIYEPTHLSVLGDDTGTCSIWRAAWIWLQVIGVFLGTWLLASKALIWVANR